MDLKSIKNKIVSAGTKTKNTIVQTTDKAISFSAKKLSNSWATIKDREVLLDTIKKSKNTTFIDKETGKRKTNKNKVIVIFWNERSAFFKSALLEYPILKTKAFSQNILLKLAKSKISGIDLKEFWIEKTPCLVLFENTKPTKIVYWNEKIQKLVKSLKLDINSELENL